MNRLWIIGLMGILIWLGGSHVRAAEVRFEPMEDRIRILVDDQLFAVYVFRDPKIPRPYFCDVHVPGGPQVTRHHPPRPGFDATDHDTFHPGIWLAFGDIEGADFWRNKAAIETRILRAPQGGQDKGSFTVENKYLQNDRVICTEECTYDVQVLPQGILLWSTSVFRGEDDFGFGDQEEMGLGIRVATPIAVKNGGTMLSSDGAQNEDAIWGTQSAWCDYSGEIDGLPVGILVMPDPGNFRRCWWHARDYGFLAANPFGRQAFTKGEKSRVVVEKGKELRLGYGVLIHSGSPFDPEAAYREFLQLMRSED